MTDHSALDMSEFKTLNLSCLCGRCRFSTPVATSSLPIYARICHCYACQHSSGTLGMPYFDWPGAYPDFSMLKRYEFSPRVWIHFCPNCGTQMFWQMHQGQRALKAAVGPLDVPDEAIKIDSHLFVAASGDGGSADWLPIVNDRPLPRWAEHQEDNPKDLSQLVPLGWRRDQNMGMREPLLRARCLCGGVEFFVTKPSDSPSPSESFGDEWWLDTNDRFVAGMCACRSCRLSSGNDVMHWAYVPTANIQLTNGQPYSRQIGTMQWYQSSNKAERSFCSTCGATVFYQHDRRMTDDWTGLFDVAAGLFCSPFGARAEDWLYWITTRITAADSAAHATAVKALTAGFRAWGDRTYGPETPMHNDEYMLRGFAKLVNAAKMHVG